ncbi:short-chain alcohol dehydrogenase [Cenarchaeum symbiosum A]|uniref:Short-chain alcohol dehydrogenase n=1 Tax=Cenarchaeum symbiosum (strain A) TaxID=414004 RepID=A0RX79_CENSY|nr:short-chain alcohol dehydrogenase [Cenarchaeum symbiosum A]
MRLEGKVAVVTGASSDIGASIVRRLAEEGAKVVLLGRRPDALEAARRVSGHEESTASIPCDVTDEGQLAQMADRVVEAYGRIDILVNGAGSIHDPKHFHVMPIMDVKKMIHGNVLGVLLPTRAVLGKMMDTGGVIINIGSISAERAIPRVHLAAYSSTKAAVVMFTKSIAVEYARRNIRCNCINPGIVDSGMIKPYLEDPDARRILEERQPLKRIGTPADIANAVLFLASDEASWITGAVLNVDGGKSASEA